MVPVVPAVPTGPLVPEVLCLWSLSFFILFQNFFYGSSGSSISISFTGSSNSNFSRLKNFYWWFWQFQLSKAFKFLWLNLFVFFVIYVECCYIVNLLTIIWITLTQGLNTQKIVVEFQSSIVLTCIQFWKARYVSPFFEHDLHCPCVRTEVGDG